MLAPWRVPLDEGELLLLDELGEVVGREAGHGRGRGLPVGVVLPEHVLDDLVGCAPAVVVLDLDALAEEGEGGEALDHVLLGQLALLGGVHLGQGDVVGLQLLCGLGVLWKPKISYS